MSTRPDIEQSDGYAYTCYVCKRELVAEPGWDATAEAMQWLTPTEIATGDDVCDDCWQEMRAGMPDMDARLKARGL